VTLTEELLDLLSVDEELTVCVIDGERVGVGVGGGVIVAVTLLD
jgi:hypothetical protein